jgi:hypothetical protein
MGKDEETEELIKIFVRSIKRAEKKQVLNVRNWMFIFSFDVGRWMFDVRRSSFMGCCAKPLNALPAELLFCTDKRVTRKAAPVIVF